MKRRLCFLLAIACSLMVMCGCSTKKSTYQLDPMTSYQPEYIRDISLYQVEEGERYIILYDSANKDYLLARVDNQGLDKDLLILGKEVYNFQESQDGLLTIVSSKDHIVFYKDKYEKIEDKHNDVVQIGLIEISYDSQNQDIQVVHNKRPVGAHIPIEQYDHFIAIDIIQVN